MKELFQVLQPYELVFITYIVIYGIPFGIKNTILRLYCICSLHTFKQADRGKVFDGIFWFCLLVEILLNF